MWVSLMETTRPFEPKLKSKVWWSSCTEDSKVEHFANQTKENAMGNPFSHGDLDLFAVSFIICLPMSPLPFQLTIQLRAMCLFLISVLQLPLQDIGPLTEVLQCGFRLWNFWESLFITTALSKGLHFTLAKVSHSTHAGFRTQLRSLHVCVFCAVSGHSICIKCLWRSFWKLYKSVYLPWMISENSELLSWKFTEIMNLKLFCIC